MALEQYIPTRRRCKPPAAVTVRADGRLTFNVAASLLFQQLGARFATLFGDRETKRVEIHPCIEDYSRHCVRVTVTQISPLSTRASLEGAAFFEWLGYDYTSRRRFQLLISNNVLTFVAMAEPPLSVGVAAVPATHNRPLITRVVAAKGVSLP